MRGSVLHDALYQLMRLGPLETEYREHADNLLRDICVADGMVKLRGWYVHKPVRWFGAKNAAPGNEPKDEITCIPEG